MDRKDSNEVLMSWMFMGPMEQAVWATTFALHAQDADAGIEAADAAVLRMRSTGATRSFRPEPEFEAARSNINIERDEFGGWYRVAYRIRHGKERGYAEPSDQQIDEAFERYERGLCDYY